MDTTVQTPILVVDTSWMLFIGVVGQVPEHAALVPIFGAGLDGDIEVEIEGDVLRSEAAIIPGGMPRSVNAFDRRLAVMAMDPVVAPSGLRDTAAALRALRNLHRDFTPDAWGELLRAVGLRSLDRDIPDPVLRAAELIEQSATDNLRVHEIAAEVGLSASRLQHLFREHLGSSLRSYRTWSRFRSVVQSVASHATLTDAASQAGFFDQAHFNRSFGQSFGVTPSFVFGPGLRIHVVGERLG